MNYVSLVLTLLNGLSTLIVWLHEKELISEHDKAIIATAMEKQSLVIKGAVEARDAQSKLNAAVPQSDSLPDDGFRRD